MSQERLITLEREDLYRRVWSTPMCRLAKEYGLSDRGLAKICTRMEIPVPGVGYWRKLECHKKATNQPLPQLSDRGVAQVTVRNRDSTATDAAPSLIILVPEKLDDPHPLTKFTRAILRRSKVLPDKTIEPCQSAVLDLRVSRRLVDRALRIADALVKSLESRGHVIRARDDQPKTAVSIEGQDIYFSINEIITPKKIPEHVRTQRWYSTEYRHIPSGKLSLRIDDGWSTIRRRTWNDGRRQRVENCLGSFVVTIEQIARDTRAHNLEWEEKRRRWDEEARQRRVENARRTRLEQELSAWKSALEVRQYFARLEAVCAKTRCPELASWIQWGKMYADQLDPTIPAELNSDTHDQNTESTSAETNWISDLLGSE